MDTTAPSGRIASCAGNVTAANASRCAYLTVHAESGRSPRPRPSPWQRLRTWWRIGRRSGTPEALSLTLADRHGHTVLSLPNADPVLGIALTPGTYHLTAVRGGARRGYTVSLPAGSRFDLHLRFSLCKQPTQSSVASGPPRSGTD